MHKFIRIAAGSKPYAEAVVCGIDGESGIRARVGFYAAGCGSLVTVEASGLPENEPFVAVHIHNGTDCAESRTHLSLKSQEHPKHTGDFPSLLNNGGYAWSAFYTDRFMPRQVVGYPVIIHAHGEDFRTQPSGDPGAKAACGRIKKL